jgi:hypothetical protein
MLPDWDFGGDDTKRGAFITWVERELDRFAMLSSGRYQQLAEAHDWPTLLAESVSSPRAANRPADAFAGLNAMVWEYEVLRYMFNRYWPGRKRPSADSASALRIAVNRCRRGLPRETRSLDRLKAHRSHTEELVEKLRAELKRRTPSAGRREAAADIAYLASLPAHHFAR